MSKHATANMGQHCGEAFSTTMMVNHSALPLCDVLLPALLGPSWGGMQGVANVIVSELSDC